MPYSPYHVKPNLSRERPWVFVCAGLFNALAFARLGASALLLAAAGCGYFLWRRRHLHEFVIDRWGVPPPEELS